MVNSWIYLKHKNYSCRRFKDCSYSHRNKLKAIINYDLLKNKFFLLIYKQEDIKSFVKSNNIKIHKNLSLFNKANYRKS